MNLFNLSGKRALITGSTKGIGKAIAERFAEHGAKVVISSRKEDICIQVRDEINKSFLERVLCLSRVCRNRRRLGSRTWC